MRRIPEIPLVPQPMTPEARAAVGFKWNDEGGTRHRLGGEPSWQQTAEWPACPHCKEQMSFYGQLDSIGDEYDLADVGMLYVFVCFECLTTKSVLQSG
jgi:hypothetical protein